MYLPSPPTVEERDLFLDSGRLRLYFVSVGSTLALIAGMVLFVRTNPLFIPYTLFAGLTVFYLLISYLIGFLGKDFNLRRHRILVQKWLDHSAHQTVDIFLPVCGEPWVLLKNTWKYVAELNAIHEGTLFIHVLDDNDDPSVKALADTFRFNYIARGTNELKKAGNLRHAFAKTKAEFIVIFDADFCPRTDFLISTLPYMFEHPNCAIVQTPQFFSPDLEQNFIQKGAGAIQELFYRLIQVSRNSFRGAICVGTNAVYRRKSLEPFGGTAAIGYSEDVRTGFRCQAAGERVIYIPINLAKGICPDNWRSFFTQQYRWAMGSLDLMCSKEFWIASISPMQRVCYLTGMLYYTTTGLSAVFAFMPSIYLLIWNPHVVLWYNLLWALPSLLLTNLYMRYWQKTKFPWSAVECRHVSYYAHLFALWDTIAGTPETWIPTGSTTTRSGRYALYSIVLKLHVLLIITTLIGLISLRIRDGYDWTNFAPLTLLAIYWIVSLKRAVQGIN